jgi:transposase
VLAGPVQRFRANIMDDLNADAKDGFRRIEVLTGPARRRRWSAAEKAQIVAETLLPAASVSDVARRWQVCSQQVFTWRREARAGHLALPAEAVTSSATSFVPVVTETKPGPHKNEGVVAPAADGVANTSIGPCIEIRLAGAVIRVATGTDCALLTDALRALRKSAA